MIGYSCKQAMRIASDALDRPLSTGERMRLRLHLFMCRDCRVCAEEFRMLHAMARGMDAGLRLDAETRAGILAEIRRLAR